MRIGVLLRHFATQRGGIGTYTRGILDALLAVDLENHYVLIYGDTTRLGAYADYPHVTEVVAEAHSRLTWDQVVIPRIARAQSLDLIFNPKLSVPFLAPCKTVFVMHGGEWFTFPENYKLLDRLYHRVFAPLYFSRADAVISVSNSATVDIQKAIGGSANKLHTVYHGVDKRFRRVVNPARLREVRSKYDLPDRFLLWAGQIYPMKNLRGLIQALHLVRDRLPHQLILVGKKELKYTRDLQLIESLRLQDRVRFAGWVEDEDLPAFYSLAEAFVFPSFYEGFGLPILEAMACGCPVVTSGRGAQKEVAGDAAVFVNPECPESIAEGVERVVAHPDVRAELVLKGARRVEAFSWEQCARTTLQVFRSVVPNS